MKNYTLEEISRMVDEARLRPPDPALDALIRLIDMHNDYGSMCLIRPKDWKCGCPLCSYGRERNSHGS